MDLEGLRVTAMELTRLEILAKEASEHGQRHNGEHKPVKGPELLGPVLESRGARVKFVVF